VHDTIIMKRITILILFLLHADCYNLSWFYGWTSDHSLTVRLFRRVHWEVEDSRWRFGWDTDTLHDDNQQWT